MGLYVFSSAIAFIAGYLILRSNIPSSIKEAAPSFDGLNWKRGVISLMILEGVVVINQNADIILLGALGEVSDVGILKIAIQFAMLMFMMFGVVNIVIAPTISRLYAEGDLCRLSHLAVYSARFSLFCSLPLAIIFIIAGEDLLSLFGHEFTQGVLALRILIIGQLVNVAAGSVGLLLTMTGHENTALEGMVIGMFTNILLCFCLIPYFGIEGAAIASTMSMIIYNALLVRKVRRILGINPSVFGMT